MYFHILNSCLTLWMNWLPKITVTSQPEVNHRGANQYANTCSSKRCVRRWHVITAEQRRVLDLTRYPIIISQNRAAIRRPRPLTFLVHIWLCVIWTVTQRDAGPAEWFCSIPSSFPSCLVAPTWMCSTNGGPTKQRELESVSCLHTG